MQTPKETGQTRTHVPRQKRHNSLMPLLILLLCCQISYFTVLFLIRFCCCCLCLRAHKQQHHHKWAAFVGLRPRSSIKGTRMTQLLLVTTLQTESFPGASYEWLLPGSQITNHYRKKELLDPQIWRICTPAMFTGLLTRTSDYEPLL